MFAASKITGTLSFFFFFYQTQCNKVCCMFSELTGKRCLLCTDVSDKGVSKWSKLHSRAPAEMRFHAVWLHHSVHAYQSEYWHCLSNLYSGLCKFRPLSQLLSGVDVRIMRPFESLLQLFQLLGGESGAAAPLLPFKRQVGLRIDIWTIICPVTWGEKERTEGH